MMRSGAKVIFAEEGAWRIGVLARGGSVSMIDAPAGSLAEALATAGGSREVVLALTSRDCLCAPISTVDLPAGRQRGGAMRYRLEEKLPVAAEDVVADFISAGERALGVCVERRALQPRVSTIEAAGVRVIAVCPASVLALQQFTAANPASTALQMILWATGAHTAELFVLADGRLVAWYVLPDAPADVALHVRMAMLTSEAHPSNLIACGASADVVSNVRELGIDVVESPAVDVSQLATLAARGRTRAWINFVDGGAAGQASRGTRWMAAAIFLLLTSIAAALFVRAARYERLTAQYQTETESLFRQALPGQPVPEDVRSRLASEAQAGPRATSVGATRSAAQGRNLLALRDMMTHLPADAKFRVYELRLGDGAFTLEGEAASLGDADAVATSLRAGSGFEVEPPRTQQRPGKGVSFTINGSIAEDGRTPR